jgi:stage III sporulation protein SpoIIIAA
VSAVKKNKKDNITPDNIGAIMLCTIPNISATTANVIMKKYGTIEEMLKTLREKGINDLRTIAEPTGKDGKTRKINKTVINNISYFLLSTNNITNL